VITFECSVGSVDDYIGSRHPTGGFYQGDTEGADYLVLVGARGTICRDKPALYVEIDVKQLAAFGATPGYVFTLLKE
jgi:hypothetical protein